MQEQIACLEVRSRNRGHFLPVDKKIVAVDKRRIVTEGMELGAISTQHQARCKVHTVQQP
jgi:hypothetical protein